MTDQTINIITPKETFKRKVKNLSKTERNKIKAFIVLFQKGGFDAINNHYIGGYKVRNKCFSQQKLISLNN